MVNEKCSLVLGDCFEYDFSSCFYRILKGLGWDLSSVSETDKEKRNIQIGYIQKENPRVGQYLQETVTNLVDHYLRENQIQECDVILRQKDGMTLTKRLHVTDTTMPIELRGLVSKLIIDVSRKKWLIVYSDGEVVPKGIPKRLYDMSFYDSFRNLDYSNKANLIKGLEGIRQRIFSDPKISWFLQEEEDGNFSIPIVGVGFIKVNRSAVRSLSPNDVDRRYLWEEYVWPFSESILIHCST